MPVNTASKEYAEMAPKWERCRDAYGGSDSVKAAGTKYLPQLGSHKNVSGDAKYEAYKMRALFYNATARTVDGLAGGIFQKEGEIKAPPEVLDHLKDVTLADQSAELLALESAKEVLTVGRVGLLVDYANRTAGGEGRPYWASYTAENIVSHRSASISGDQILTRVVLREVVTEDDPKDTFKTVEVERYRVLELVPTEAGGIAYTQTVWVKNDKKSSSGDDWVIDRVIAPMRRGRPLAFIPFVFLGPTSVSPTTAKPPLLDLVETNLSHYRIMADLHHGLHFTALPTPYIAGNTASNDDGPLALGSETILALSEGSSAGMLEFTGQGLGALERADERHRHMMAVLGARMLEEQPQTSQSETAFAVNMRHAGEQATLRTLAQALETGLTMALQWHTWWVDNSETPHDTKAMFELNKDFTSTRLPPEELRALVEAFQGGAMSFETLYYNLTRGDLGRPGVGSEEELRAIIGKAAATRSALDMEGEDEVVQEGINPYRVVRRGRKYLVIKTTTGETVGEHETRRTALAQLAALEANVEE